MSASFQRHRAAAERREGGGAVVSERDRDPPDRDGADQKMAIPKKRAVKKTAAPAGTEEAKAEQPKKRRSRRKKNQAEIIGDLLENLEKKLIDPDGSKGTIGDYIRLLQMQRELTDEGPKEISVRWVDKENEESSKEGSSTSRLNPSDDSMS